MSTTGNHGVDEGDVMKQPTVLVTVGGDHTLARRVPASLGRLDVLVNKVGTAFIGRVLRMPINGEPETAADHGSGRARPRLILAALAGVLALALSACGTSGATTTTPPADQAGPTVAIEDLAYTPETLTVQAGATVTWVWRDGAVAHDVKGDGFRSEVMAEGTFRHRFTQPGSYDYLCTLHPNMTGTIEVTR
jgi:plastocyanin